MSKAAKKQGRPASNGAGEFTNEQIRKIAKGCEMILAERLPREAGMLFQTRFQIAKFALVPVDAEHDRLTKMYAKRDRRGQFVAGEEPGSILLAQPEKWATETTALWASKQRVALTPIKRAEIPEKVEGKPLVVPGVVWDFLAPILVD